MLYRKSISKGLYTKVMEEVRDIRIKNYLSSGLIANL